MVLHKSFHAVLKLGLLFLGAYIDLVDFFYSQEANQADQCQWDGENGKQLTPAARLRGDGRYHRRKQNVENNSGNRGDDAAVGIQAHDLLMIECAHHVYNVVCI